jgi:hypothetical protein
MGLHDPFGHLQRKLWPKEKSIVKLAIWLPTTGSWESTQLRCVQVACDMSLERSRRGLQLWFRPCCDRRFAPKVIVPQSCRTPSLGDFETPIWSGAKYTIWGKVLTSRKSGPWWVLWVRGRPWLILAPKVFQPCANRLVCWFCAGLLEWVNYLSLLLVPSRSSNTPLYPSKVLKAGNVPRAPNLSIVFILGLNLSLPRGLGMRQFLTLILKAKWTI